MSAAHAVPLIAIRLNLMLIIQSCVFISYCAGCSQQQLTMRESLSLVVATLLIVSGALVASAQRTEGFTAGRCETGGRCDASARTSALPDTAGAAAAAPQAVVVQQRPVAVQPNAGYVNITSVRNYKCYDNRQTEHYIGEPFFLPGVLNSTQTITDVSCTVTWYPNAPSCDCVERGTCTGSAARTTWNTIWALDQNAFAVTNDGSREGWWCSWIRVLRTTAGKRGVVDTMVSYSVTTFFKP